MPLTLLLTVILVAVPAVEALAQSVTVPLSESAFTKTRDAMRIWRFCEEGDLSLFEGLEQPTAPSLLNALSSVRGCTDQAVERVVDFVENRRNPPSRSELDTALESLRADLVQNNLLPSSAPGGEPSSSAGFLSFPTAAMAVTGFLMDRARAELVQSAFADLADALESGDLAILLPRTGRVVRNAKMIDYRSLLPTFRAALREDLRALPETVVDAELSFYRVCRRPDDAVYGRPETGCRNGDQPDRLVPDGMRLIGSAAGALLRLDGGDDVLLVLSDMFDPDASWEDPAIGRVVQVTARMALEMRAYRAFAGATGRTAQEGLAATLRHPRQGAVFLAFLHDDLDLPGTIAEFVTENRTQVEGLARALGDLVAATTSSGGFPGTQVDPAVVRERSAVAVVAVLRAGLPVFLDAAESRALRRDLETPVALWRAAEDRDYPRIVVFVTDRIILGMTDAGVDASGIPMRILSFASAFAAAESGEDMQEALDNLADPVGSFRSRRLKNAVKVSLVSYVGASGGRETLDLQEDAVNYVGAFAPIGLELSWGTGWSPISSVGIYASFVDLGTLVSYRLDDGEISGPEGETSVDDAPDVNLEHVFSPAVHLVLGISRSYPFSLGIGWQHAPELRSLEDGTARLAADRLSFFLGVDLTLLRF